MDIFWKIFNFVGEVLTAFLLALGLVALFYVFPLMEYTA